MTTPSERTPPHLNCPIQCKRVSEVTCPPLPAASCSVWLKLNRPDKLVSVRIKQSNSLCELHPRIQPVYCPNPTAPLQWTPMCGLYVFSSLLPGKCHIILNTWWHDVTLYTHCGRHLLFQPVVTWEDGDEFRWICSSLCVNVCLEGRSHS